MAEPHVKWGGSKQSPVFFFVVYSAYFVARRATRIVLQSWDLNPKLKFFCLRNVSIFSVKVLPQLLHITN